MSHTLPPLPYPMDALEPIISKETLEYHYGKHHKGYVTKLNALIEGSRFQDSSLEDTILYSVDDIFNNAAQIWNHTFYWQCLSPKGGGEPSGELGKEISSVFGSFETFSTRFTDAAVANFGSGWTWLVLDKAGSLSIVSTGNAGTPMTSGQTALLTCDVWEHAYYIDYRNVRKDYVTAFWKLVNWEFVAQNWAKARSRRV